MTAKFHNLGILEAGTVEVGQFTVLCGVNNTGKTYITHATFALLDFLRREFLPTVPDAMVSQLAVEGAVTVPISNLFQSFSSDLQLSCHLFSSSIPHVLAADKANFKDCLVELEFPSSALDELARSLQGNKVQRSGLVEGTLSDDAKVLHLLLPHGPMGDGADLRSMLKSTMVECIRELVFTPLFPRAFISSAERTGAAIFQKELDFTRNRLIEILGENSSKLEPYRLLGQFTSRYPYAVRRNVDFIREIPNLSLEESPLFREAPSILEDLERALGGTYKVSGQGEVRFVPAGARKGSLSLVESSSSVRSLLDLFFYLHHQCAPGDVLFVDEPELNLHPANQRAVARLLARLTDYGVRVWITTHSDYIIKELNSLIMLHSLDDSARREIAQEFDLHHDQALPPEGVRAYIAGEELVKTAQSKRRVRRQTVSPTDFDECTGIAIPSFDAAIAAQDRLQELAFGQLASKQS
jgi:hypothetical protein